MTYSGIIVKHSFTPLLDFHCTGSCCFSSSMEKHSWSCWLVSWSNTKKEITKKWKTIFLVSKSKLSRYIFGYLCCINSFFSLLSPCLYSNVKLYKELGLYKFCLDHVRHPRISTWPLLSNLRLKLTFFCCQSILNRSLQYKLLYELSHVH